MARLDQYLKEVLERGGSDLHLSAGSTPIMRLHGELVKLGTKPLAPSETQELLLEVLTTDQCKALDEAKNIDFAYEITHVNARQRFRVNAYYQRTGMDGVFRVIPSQIPTLQSLGLPDALARLTRYHQGLVLMTGPAGSGKTSTLAALLNVINEERPTHIITIEDPIEYIHSNKRALINQRQVQLHTKSFHAALKSALREDPDVILVGELRDLETIQLAITASETGHLVFGTLHTSSAAKTIDRLIDAFPPAQQAQIRTMISESLRGVISQVLIPRTDGWGRVPAVEIITGCLPISNLIREGKTYQIPSVMQTGRALGMLPLDESLMELLRANRIRPQDAFDYSNDKKLFEPHLRV